MKRPARVPSQLPESMHKRLNAYALAASAAGVGVLALAQPAEARIVYTPAHERIAPGSPYALDLNHDGTPDFIITANSISGYGLFVCPANSRKVCDYGYKGREANAIWGHTRKANPSGFAWASALAAGAKVGPNYGHFRRHYRGGNSAMILCSLTGNCSGSWVGADREYLGFKFFISGKAHYGWARLNTEGGTTLTGYAYETVPNKPIITGKTEGDEMRSLGALAGGAVGLSTGRQK